MLTDSPPRDGDRAGFLKRDRLTTLGLPERGRLPNIATSIEAAVKAGKTADLACAEFLKQASEFYRVPPCGLAARPLRVREHWTSELFGDYHIESMVIPAVDADGNPQRSHVFCTFLSTLCHEFCHHLDVHLFGFADSWHTRGFYEGTAVLTISQKGRRENGSSGVRAGRTMAD